MSDELSPQEALRIETVLEGVENFARAVIAKDIPTRSNADLERRNGIENEYARARDELATALRAFTAPLVRIINGGLVGQQAQEPGDELKCNKCGGVTRCRLDCPDWHATIREKIDTADETFEICDVCDCPNDPSVLCCEKSCPRRADGDFA